MEIMKINLAKNFQEYIQIILEKYDKYIPEDRKAFLKSIQHYEEMLEIADTGTISLYCYKNKIYFPQLAFKILESFKNNSNYGKNPDHKCYTEETLIINDNTFNDYINHAIIAGITPEQYFQESLLHETMHFCGCGGADPLREGLTELKTRELAKEKKLLTSSCGYPKEIALVLELQEIFGEDTMNKIAFAPGNKIISDILIETHGQEAEELYFKVRREMKLEFDHYISQKFDGPTAHEKKAETYSRIDYSKAYQLLAQYRNNQELKQMTTKKGEDIIGNKNKNI